MTAQTPLAELLLPLAVYAFFTLVKKLCAPVTQYLRNRYRNITEGLRVLVYFIIKAIVTITMHFIASGNKLPIIKASDAS